MEKEHWMQHLVLSISDAITAVWCVLYQDVWTLVLMRQQPVTNASPLVTFQFQMGNSVVPG